MQMGHKTSGEARAVYTQQQKSAGRSKM